MSRPVARNLLPDTVRVLELRPGSLVFANACASSAPVLTFGRFTTFGWEFYRHGAATFVGTLGPVPISYAVDFAAAVYAELFRASGSVTIGQALAAARQAAAPRHNLFWLLYCLYGDPDLRLDLRPAS